MPERREIGGEGESCAILSGEQTREGGREIRSAVRGQEGASRGGGR